VFVSALSGQRVRKCLDMILEVHEERHRRIDTSEVNRVLEKLLFRQPPPLHRGHRVKIKYGTQVTVRPPTFAIFTNYPKALPDSYIRFLQSGFRHAWSFMGTPIRLRPRAGKDRHDKE
jgi:GTPase